MKKRGQKRGTLRREFIRTGFSTLATAAAAVSSRASQATRRARPNILFIIADDLGQQCRCYGDRIARTPNIDQLASQGVLFENAYVTTSICSPSRASMFTGLFPQQHGLLGMAQWGYRVLEGAPLLPNLLKQEGYRTGLIGKTHMTSLVPWQWDYRKTPADEAGRAQLRDPRSFAERTQEFFSQDAEDPFFLSVNFVDPHTPHSLHRISGLPEDLYTKEEVKPLPFMGEWDTPVLRESVAGYYNNVSRLDTGVGLVLAALERSGHSQNTIVIFVGDHGPGFHRAKQSCYEAGVKVPLIIRWPGNSIAGLRRKELVSTIDMLPTALRVAGARIPGGLTGRPLDELVEGKQVEWRETILTEYHSNQCADFYPRRTVRDERYKLILNLLHERPCPASRYMRAFEWYLVPNYEALKGTATYRAFQTFEHPPKVELYDLEKDPHEYNNLGENKDYHQTTKRLLGELRAWRERTRDRYLDPAYLERMTEYHDRGAEEQKRTREVYHARMHVLYPDGGDFAYIK